MTDALDVTAVCRENFARIHRAALVLSGNPWDADDLAQETFLVLARKPEKYQGRSGIYTWLYGILLNLERRERRRRSTRTRKLRILWESESAQEPLLPPAETAVEVAEWKNCLWSRVGQLPDGQRQALVLRFSEQLRYEEIAEVLQCPLGTVKSRIHLGLAAVKRILDEEDEELRKPPQHPGEDVSRAI